MDVLRRERDDAVKSKNEAWSQLLANAACIATLQAKNEYMTEEIARLREEIHAMRRDMQGMKRTFKESGLGGLGDK